MFKDVIYIEEDIIDEPYTITVVKKIKPKNIIPIKHYKDVFNQSGSNWRFQKTYQKIILAKKTESLIYKGSDITPNFGFKHFYYNTPALNCIYDCDYCYLQGMLGSAHMVLFLNNIDLMNEALATAKKHNTNIYLALSYDTDLLAIEHYYPYCKEWIEFVRNNKQITIEIRTKSINTNALKSILPTQNVILAWTLSPQHVVNRFEPKTPSADARIKAIKTAIAWGWRVRICFDPILLIPKWENYYKQLLDNLKENIKLNDADSFSIGVFRMNKNFLKNIQSQRKDSGILFYNYTVKNEIATYNDETSSKLSNFIKEYLINENVTKPIEIVS